MSLLGPLLQLRMQVQMRVQVRMRIQYARHLAALPPLPRPPSQLPLWLVLVLPVALMLCCETSATFSLCLSSQCLSLGLQQTRKRIARKLYLH